MALVAHFVAAFQEIDCFKILPAAEAVWNPLSLLAGVVQVKHRSNGVHSQAVHMVFFQPEERVSDEEIFYLVSAVVEDERAPVLVLSQAGVLMLVKATPIVAGESVGILWKVSRHPVQNHSNSRLMAAVHKIPKFIGIPKSTCRRVVIHHLVAP